MYFYLHRHVLKKIFEDDWRLNATNWGTIAFSLFLAGSAGIRQPCPRSSGAVEGHDGSPRESGVCMAQAEHCLNLFSQRRLYARLTWCSRAAGPAFPVVRPQSCTPAESTLIDRTINYWMYSEHPGSRFPQWQFRCWVVNMGCRTKCKCWKRFFGVFCVEKNKFFLKKTVEHLLNWLTIQLHCI